MSKKNVAEKSEVVAECAFTEVHAHAESIKNDGEHVVEGMEVGDMWAQGDIGILKLKSLPKDATKTKEQNIAQLAPGNTQGSRHHLRSLDGITQYKLANATVLDGPTIEATKEFWVDHPEHGNVKFEAGVYSVVFQRAFAEELRRVQD